MGNGTARLKTLARQLWAGPQWYWRLLRVVVATWVLIVVLAMLFEERLIFFPTKYPGGDYDRAAEPPPDDGSYPKIEDVWLTASDGVRLHAWFAQAARRAGGKDEPVTPLATILYLHGNAGNLSHRYEKLLKLASLPADVLIVDYRGYGRSEGAPNEAGVYRDADAAWRELTERRGLPPARLVLYGESLGGAVAVELATRVPVGGLVTESTFTSIPAMGRSAYPFIPSCIVRTQMDSLARIPRLTCPKLILHGEEDEVIPFRMGRELFAAAPEPKTFLAVPGAGHDDLAWAAGRKYLEALRSFLTALPGK